MKKPVLYLIAALLLFSCSRKLRETVVSEVDSKPIVSLQDFFEKNDIRFELIQRDSLHFEEAYKFYVQQPVDHNNPALGTFSQKVYLSHASYDAPMVMYINGYSANSNSYITEPCKLLKSNQIHIEHRYFNESIPNDMDPKKMFDESNPLRDYLNIEQAARDHHAIVQLLKQLYKGKWLSTGISKGGQATIFHKRFFPNDVDVAIPYVAPINLKREDPRIEEHLNSVGTEACRKLIFDFQKSLLENRKETLNLFSEISHRKGLSYIMDENKVLELSILEFEFAFWQWDGNCAHIPSANSSLKNRMNFLFEIDAPGFFTTSITSINSFFYQGYNQIGMYGYDIDPFGDLIQTFSEDVDNQDIFLNGIEMPEYDSQAIPDVVNWLDENGNNMIYIVGELDPWGATAIEPSDKTNSLNFTLEGGNHSTRIIYLSEKEKNQIKDSLRAWMNIPVYHFY